VGDEKEVFSALFSDETSDDEMDDSELDALMRSMPPEMFEQLLREDARGGGEAGEEAAALVALLEEMGEMGLEGLGLPPELAGLAGRARAGGRLSGESARGAFSRGAGAGPAGPGEGGGGGGGAGARRARARHAGQSAFRRGKKGGSPGTRPAPAARADADDAIPAVAGSGDVDSSARGSRTEKNRRKKARKKEKEKETTSFSSQRVTKKGKDSLSEPHVGDPKPVPIKWAPDASRKTEARETEKNDFVDREVSRRWVAAAKAGDVNALRFILEETDTVSSFTNDDEKKKTNAKRTMLAHRSPGIGHTALHWTSSRGADALDATFFLLTECAVDPNVRNEEGATPLHAAAGVGSMETLALLASRGADPRVRDDAGETAADLAQRRGHAAFAAACRDGETVFRSHFSGTEKESPSSLSLSGEDVREREGVSTGVSGVSGVSDGPEGDAAGARASGEGGPPRASSASVGAVAGGAESDSSDDEASKAAKLAAMSAEAKRKGNAAFAAGEFAKAVKQFTMAIRMDKTNHVLFSNRSAAHAGLGRYEDALADAERCVRMSPKWGKGYGRKGAALTGLGQGGEAVKAYLAGLAVEPESESLRAGLAEAKAAIRRAQARYEEMWGKDAPAGSAAEGAEGASDAPASVEEKTETVRDAPAGIPIPTNASSPPSPPSGALPPPAPSPETLEATRAVNALPRAETRRWLAAAKAGDLSTLEAMLAENRAFLYAWGKGTSFGFTANTAMHWASAQGHLDIVRWLLRQGASPDARNNNDSAPLHSAAGAGRGDVLFLLLVEGGADATLRDGCDETARDVAIAAGGRKRGPEVDGARLAAVIDLGARVAKLRASVPDKNDINASASAMDLKTCREVLHLAEVETRAFAEKREFVDATREYLNTLPPLIRPPGGKWVARPSLTADAEPPAAPATAPAENEGHVGQTVRQEPDAPTPDPPSFAGGAPGDAESDSSDDEASKAAKLAAMSAEAKRKGNAAFAAGEFAKAVKQFTMAIRMDKTNHVLFSNRSAAHAGLGRYEAALADAERCVRMSPKWGKGYGRKGAALTGLGQGGEAVKAYLAGLAVEPESESLRAGLLEAKAAIRRAQARYEEMWGKDAPVGSAAEEP
jgi:tetratricopeptide (TPR) repeat protein